MLKKQLSEGKLKNQALKCVSRRLVNIIYKVMKEQHPGIVGSDDDWTVANMEANLGETLSGIIIFQLPSEDIFNEDADFFITHNQIGNVLIIIVTKLSYKICILVILLSLSLAIISK